MQQDLFDRSAAKARRDLGILRACSRADRASCQWTVTAIACLRSWAPGREPFLAEVFREHAEKLVGKPPDGRAWGAVMRQAPLAGIVRQVGYAKALSSNHSPKCLWSAV